MPIITPDFFEMHMTQLGLKATFSPKAEQLDELIAEASEWVEDYLRRKVMVTQVTEIVRGRNLNRILLDHWPIISLDSIDWSEGSGRLGDYDVNDVRILPHGAIEFKRSIHGPFVDYKTYTIVYTAGMDPIPYVIKRATALKVVDLFSPMYQGARDARLVEFVSNVQVMIADLLETARRDRTG